MFGAPLPFFKINDNFDSAMNPMTHIDRVNGLRYNYEYDSYGTITAISAYLPSGASGYVFVGTNSLGDVNALYNANGDLIVKYEYDAWGKVLAETDANGNALTGVAATWSQLNPFRYRGYYYDVETGLYYLQSRYYDPEVGRFINSDAIVNTTENLGFNTYAYCGNSPVDRIDPTGYDFFDGWNTLKQGLKTFTNDFGTNISVNVIYDSERRYIGENFPVSVYSGWELKHNKNYGNVNKTTLTIHTNISEDNIGFGIESKTKKFSTTVEYSLLDHKVSVINSYYGKDITKSVKFSCDLNYRLDVEFSNEFPGESNVTYTEQIGISFDLPWLVFMGYCTSKVPNIKGFRVTKNIRAFN